MNIMKSIAQAIVAAGASVLLTAVSVTPAFAKEPVV